MLGAPVAQFNEGGIAGVSEYPDLVGNIRIDQSWGTWLVGAALHSIVASTILGSTDAPVRRTAAGRTQKIGWAVTTGFIWNLPMIAPGDRLSAGIVYSEGAIGYAAVTPSGGATNTAYNRVNGNQVSYGMFQDAAYESVGLAASAVCGLNTGGGCGRSN